MLEFAALKDVESSNILYEVLYEGRTRKNSKIGRPKSADNIERGTGTLAYNSS